MQINIGDLIYFNTQRSIGIVVDTKVSLNRRAYCNVWLTGWDGLGQSSPYWDTEEFTVRARRAFLKLAEK